MTRRNDPITEKEWDVFFDFLALNGSVRGSAQAINRSFRTLYKHKSKDPDIKKRWEEAEAEYNDAIEAEMHRRGVEGVDKPIFYQGKQVATIKEYSDQVLMKMAEGHMPEKYGRQRVEMTGRDGKDLQTPDSSEIARRLLATMREAMKKGEKPR